MPVECDIDLKIVNQDEFHQLDRIVMRHAFDIHNSLGRFCDERIYQDELSILCRSSGFDCQREFEVWLIHESFSKSYFIDLLIDRSVVYELKVSESLASAHQNQLLNYLLLTNTRHGKLVNLRPPSVQSRFVSTTMTRRERAKLRFFEKEWSYADEAEYLRARLIALLEDWGHSLDIKLYREALLHLTSSPSSGVLPVELRSRNRTIGTQKMCLIAPAIAWHLSAIKSNLASYEKHFRRLLTHTDRDQLHWINLNKGDVLLRTINNDSVAK